MLFNPEENDKLYKVQDLGVGNVCIANYGSWLLMQGPLFTLSIMNLFTGERIKLPPVELLWKEYELSCVSLDRSRWYRGKSIRSPMFWIDEKTKDYVVVWALKHQSVFYTKKGDNLWNQIPEFSDCFDLVYKDHKMYLLNHGWLFNIFDISGEIPRKTFQCCITVEMTRLLSLRYRSNPWTIQDTRLVVSVSGKVIKVEQWLIRSNRSLTFRLFNRESRKQEIESLGDEAILLDQGITVLANDTNAFIRNSIYFSAVNYGKMLTKDYLGKDFSRKDFFIFNLKTHNTELLHTYDPFDASLLQSYRDRWFLPSFTHT